MAYAKLLFAPLLLCSVFLCTLQSCNAKTNNYRYSATIPLKCNFTAIYQLGDSHSDTGNLIRESGTGVHSAFSRLPYGISFFKHPTGRCSNGLLMIDFIAKAVGLPPLNPYLNRDAILTQGVNFAVAGATVLAAEALVAENLTNPLTNSSLNVQLDWMWSHFNSICYDDYDCEKKLKNSLFIIGEIGSSDYYYALLQGKTIKDAYSMVSDIVQAIVEGVKRVIQIGASKILVPGIFPLGCIPAYLSASEANSSSTYDEYCCLSDLNNLSLYHNDQLQKVIQVLTQEHRNITVVYGDYYSSFRRLLQNAPHLGFNNVTFELLKACCGIGRQYNFNSRRTCGHRAVPVCPNPDRYIIWDGLNLTERAYRFLARWLIRSTISQLRKCT